MTDETEILTPEQAEKAWWDAWYAEDYSWEGLAKKPWKGFSVTESGHIVVDGGSATYNGQVLPRTGSGGDQVNRPASVQDYWRLDPRTNEIRTDDQIATELLKAKNGRVYHIAHYPYKNEDGTLSDKQNLEVARFEAIVISRLLDISSAQFSQYDPPAMEPPARIEWRAQFQGTSLISAIGVPDNYINIVFKQTCFCVDLAFQNVHLGAGAYFNNSLFYKDVDFSHISIGNNSFFEFCVFLGGLKFFRSHLNRYVSFNNSIFFGNSDFSSSTFYSASFTKSKFFSISKELKQKINFNNCIFYNETNFASLKSEIIIDFSNCTFNGPSKFSSLECSDLINFQDTDFKFSVDFSSTNFSAACFKNCTFPMQAVFDKATFNDNANFNRAKFDQSVYFRSANFLGKTDFKDAMFLDVAHFDGISWPLKPEDWTDAFDRALFKSYAVFTGARCQSFAAFNGAKLERGIRFDTGDEASNKKRFTQEIALEQAHDRWWTLIRSKRSEQLLLSLEGGCRVLKQAMAYDSNPLREQEFYRFELMARRAQARTRISEKVASLIYECVSDYGSSIVRPVFWIAGLVGLFGFIYLALAAFDRPIHLGWPIDWSYIGSAFNFSASRMLPFGAFASGSGAWIEPKEPPSFSWGVLLAIRFLATIQSIISLGLTFLFGLALRRRFQMG